MRVLRAALIVCVGWVGVTCKKADDKTNDAGVGDLSSNPSPDAAIDLALASDAALDASSSPDATMLPGAPPFDWVGVVGTGQSLSVGVTASYMSTTQPFHNLKLVDTSKDPSYPIGTNSDTWATAPLTEASRGSLMYKDAGYGDGQYPENIYGETPASGMANTLTTIWKARGNTTEYVTAHSVVGWSGHCLSDIDKEGGKRAYPASLEEAKQFTALAKAAGKTFGYGGIILTHGECDAGNQSYGTGLYTFWQDYNTDLKAITGQTSDVVLIISQQSTIASGVTGSAIQVWDASLAHPNNILVSGPKYQYGYNPGLLHLPAPGYEEMGEKYAEVFDVVINQKKQWKPLQPNKVTRAGAVVTIDFDVPYTPLVFDSHIPLPHQSMNTEWQKGQGFEAMNGNMKLTINSVAIKGSSVAMTLSADPGAAAKVTVNYAITEDGTAVNGGINGGTSMGVIGSLRDSDPFVGWDPESVPLQLTNGSAVVKAMANNGLVHRATKDIVTGTGIAANTVVLSHDTDSQVTLTAPFTGTTGNASLSFRHDEYNYCVHFTMTEQ